MNPLNKKDPFLLFCCDILVFFLSLWITLWIRYQEFPTNEILADHTVPFAILFAVWLLVFFITGLYEKRIIVFKSRLVGTIFRAHVTNIALAIAFFYFIPYFGITPKTNLFIYLIVSSFFILLWRIYGYQILAPRQQQNAIMIASGEEMHELAREVNSRPYYNVHFTSVADITQIDVRTLHEDLKHRIGEEKVTVLVLDFNDPRIEPLIPALYDLVFSKVVFIDMHQMYEDVFDRMPLSLLTYGWFLENISFAPMRTYDFLKRFTDIFVALIGGLISLLFYPFVIAAIKLDDGGPIFITQQRVGKDNQPIHIYKFRSMSRNDTSLTTQKSDNKITRVGAFLRKSRIDELPQLWNVIRGDLSLIGPRPELPDGVRLYEQQIPYYGVRHLIQPGLSGWAQIYHDNHAHHAAEVESTKEKLSYDLYYLKNRSLVLDITIALKTINKLLSRSGM